MLLILLSLACVPLLGLVPFHWHATTGNRSVMVKAFWLSFSASVFWSLLGDYVSVVFPGWSWLFYLLLVAGASFSAVCAWKDFGRGQRRRRAAIAALAYVLVFILTARYISDAAWLDLRDQVQAVSGLSRLRGPLQR